jgi:hypothetical protein
MQLRGRRLEAAFGRDRVQAGERVQREIGVIGHEIDNPWRNLSISSLQATPYSAAFPQRVIERNDPCERS